MFIFLNTLFTWHKIHPPICAKIHPSTTVVHEHGLSLIFRSWKGILGYRDIGKTIKCIRYIFLSKFKGIWNIEDVLQAYLEYILGCQLWRYLLKSREHFFGNINRGIRDTGTSFPGPQYLVSTVGAAHRPRLKAIHLSWLGPELLVCCLAHRGPTGVFLLLRS